MTVFSDFSIHPIYTGAVKPEETLSQKAERYADSVQRGIDAAYAFDFKTLPYKTILKCILAWIVAYIAMALVIDIASLIARLALRSFIPPEGSGQGLGWPLLAALSVINVAGAGVGGHVLAGWVPSYVYRHALGFGGFIALMGLIYARSQWGIAPLWYNVLFVVTPLPAIVAGTYYRGWRKKRTKT